MTSALDAVLQEADRLSGPVVVEQRADIGDQQVSLGVGELTATADLLAVPGRSQQRPAERARGVAVAALWE
jgi:hypothetical protein